MKKAKKMFAVVAATIMVLSMGMVSVNAADIQPRAPLCPQCSSPMRTTYTYGEWGNVGYVPCTHGFPKGDDTVMSRTVLTKIICTNSACKMTYPEKSSTEFTKICHGHY